MALITIAKFYNLVDAQIARSKLEDSGIKSFLFDENTSYMYSGAVVGSRLQVIEDDVMQARSILDIQDGESEDSSAASERVSIQNFLKKLAIIPIFAWVIFVMLMFTLSYWGNNLEYSWPRPEEYKYMTCCFSACSNKVVVDSNIFREFLSF